jgi:MoxR-like ATPase
VTPEDVKAVAAPVLGHRMALRAEAEMRGAHIDALLADLIAEIPVPRSANS